MQKIQKYFSDNLKSLRGKRSQQEFSQLLGLPQGSYARYELGRIPKPDILAQIAIKTGVEPSSLLAENLGGAAVLLGRTESFKPNAGFYTLHDRPRRKIPVVSWARAGEAANFSDLSEFIEEFVDSDTTDQNAFALILEGDSMEPDYKAGDRVIFEPNKEPRNGDCVVARLEETGGVYFKIFRRTGPEGKIVKLESLNTNYSPIEIPIEKFRFIYPAYEVKRRIRRY